MQHILKRFNVVLAALVMLTPVAAQAQTLNLQDLSQANLEKVSKETSANFVYTSASAPSSFGKRILPWLGFEVGFVGGITRTPDIDSLVPNEEIDTLPHLGIHLGFSLPYSIALESNFVPQRNIKDVSIAYSALAGRWTITDVFWEWLPISWGVLAHWSDASLSYTQRIQNSSTSNVPVQAAIKIKNTVWGANTSVGYKILDFVEPYVGAGFVFGRGEVNVSGSATVTIFTFTSAQSADAKASSLQAFGGLHFDLFFFNLGIEAMRVFGTTNYTAKVSFDF